MVLQKTQLGQYLFSTAGTFYLSEFSTFLFMFDIIDWFQIFVFNIFSVHNKFFSPVFDKFLSTFSSKRPVSKRWEFYWVVYCHFSGFDMILNWLSKAQQNIFMSRLWLTEVYLIKNQQENLGWYNKHTSLWMTFCIRPKVNLFKNSAIYVPFPITMWNIHLIFFRFTFAW